MKEDLVEFSEQRRYYWNIALILVGIILFTTTLIRYLGDFALRDVDLLGGFLVLLLLFVFAFRIPRYSLSKLAVRSMVLVSFAGIPVLLQKPEYHAHIY